MPQEMLSAFATGTVDSPGNGSSVKTSPFPFPGDLEEGFLLRPPKEGNANARGENLLAPLPSPLVVFAVGRGAGLPEKDATIERCNNWRKQAT